MPDVNKQCSAGLDLQTMHLNATKSMETEPWNQPHVACFYFQDVFSFHRPCIEEFILKTRKDPARDTPLDREQLLVNVNMRDQVAKWLQRHGVET